MIEAIFIASHHKAKQVAVDNVQVTAGHGIIGDRNFQQQRWPGQNITLIEHEKIDYFNRHHQQQISIDATRRNIITLGVDLNSLVGKQFTIGDIQLLGIELCQPCATLAELLANETITKQGVIKALNKRSGLRADVLSSGKLALGMAFSMTQTE